MTQVDILQARKKEWDVDREALKEEKKILEYDVYEMLKAMHATKEKFSRIKLICD
jgi:hypothetical protein